MKTHFTMSNLRRRLLATRTHFFVLTMLFVISRNGDAQPLPSIRELRKQHKTALLTHEIGRAHV